MLAPAVVELISLNSKLPAYFSPPIPCC
ncbi:hypothetical protein RLOC_00002824, partial [Lonchura striata]